MNTVNDLRCSPEKKKKMPLECGRLSDGSGKGVRNAVAGPPCWPGYQYLGVTVVEGLSSCYLLSQ